MLVMTSGMIMVDRIATNLPKEPYAGLTQYTMTAIEEHIGGHPANVAIDLVRLGVNPTDIGIIAAIGTDSAGTFIESTIQLQGLRGFLKRVSTPTGQNLILVPRGRDRCFNIAPGANLKLYSKDVLDVFSQHQKPKLLSIRPGYSGLDNDIASILKHLPHSFILLDLMKPFDKDWDFILPALEYVTAIHCNDVEAAAFGTSTQGSCNLDDVLRIFFDSGIELVFITEGENGANLFTQNCHIHQGAFSVDTTDPTGCGDAFCAGIIKKIIEWDAFDSVSLLTQEQLKEMLRYGQAVGAACATGIGTTAGVTEDNVRNILNR